MRECSPSLSIVDTHIHLDEPAFDNDRDEVIEAARAIGVNRFINIAHLPERWETSRVLRDRYPEVEIALGLHPQHADECTDDILDSLRNAIRTMQPVAVGETGFDFSRSAPDPVQQEHAFRAQLEIAAVENLPVVIHQRDASDALIAVLDAWDGGTPVVLHSFDGTERLADWALEQRCFVGIGGLATKHGGDALRGLVKRMPIDRLLLETDAPYLSPPGTGDRRNTPANLPLIAELLAPLWNLTRDELCRITSANAVVVFGASAAPAGTALE